MLNNTADTLVTSVSPSAVRLVGRVDGGAWRFFISSTRFVKIKITQDSPLGAIPAKIEYIAPDSAIEIQGKNAVFIECENLDSENTATITTWRADYLCGGLEPVQYPEDGLTTPDGGQWGNMGSFGGYAAPYCNQCRVYVYNEQTRIRAFAPDGTEIFLSGVQPVDERLYIDLDTPQAYRFEIRESNVSATGVNYAIIWYRE